MKSLLLLLVLGTVSTTRIFAAELIPVETFAADAEFRSARLSPDGKTVAYMAENDGKYWLYMLDLESKKNIRINPGKSFYSELPKEVARYRWISNKRIAFLTTVWDGIYWTGLTAVDKNGDDWKAFSGPDADPSDDRPLLAQSIIHSFRDKEGNVLMADPGSGEGSDRIYENVVKVCTLDGSYKTEIKNPGNVIDWGTDKDGVVRFGTTQERKAERIDFGLIYREDAKSPWRTLPTFDAKHGKVDVLGFAPDQKTLVVSALSENKRWALYLYDPNEGKLGELLASHKEYDIEFNGGAKPRVENTSLVGPIISDENGIIGVRFVTEGPIVQWVDPNFKAIQSKIDTALKGTNNLITSWADDLSAFLVFSYSDRDPGAYYLLRLSNQKLDFGKLGEHLPAFPKQELVPMNPIRYQTRDGHTIHGYLTIPAGAKPKNLPLIVMPHGGPTVRDVWEFDRDVQFLANRGYAVLQMNYRGSPGYGQEFYELGKRQIGKGIQDDIEDATKWAIAKGIADPKRIAIMGGSYGGYSALFALGKSPGLYCCGVSFAGVSDWNEIIAKRTSDEYRLSYLHWREWVGDPKNPQESPELAAISPVSFAADFSAPVLILQGKEDRTVPPKQAKLMIAALEKAGKKPESYFFSGTGHGFRDAKNRRIYYEKVEAFLLRHLGPGFGREKP